jgi:hypothetical protein
MLCAPELVFGGRGCIGPVFMFCAPGVVFGDSEGGGSNFHILRLRTRFRRYHMRRVFFSCFALPDSFSKVPRESSPVFFCAPEHIFDGIMGVRSLFQVLPAKLIFDSTEGVGSRFHVLLSRTRFRQYRGQSPVFMFYAPELVFRRAEGAGSSYNVLRSRSHFHQYQGPQVPYSCFSLPNSFLEVPRATGPVFMFHAPGLIFGGTEGVGSRYHIWRIRTHFQWFRGRVVQFSCFPLPNTFSAVPWASGPFFMFCVVELVLGGTEGVGSRFHVLLSRTRFRWYLGRRVPFSCFALPN